MSKFLFLDVDGVLNCQVFYEKRGWPSEKTSHEVANICPDRLRWLSELCADCGVQVVLSSTWRHGRTLEEIQAMFTDLGATFTVVGVTPSLHFQEFAEDGSMPSVPRGSEIKYWLDHTPRQWSNYAIIDDDADMLLEQAPHFFRTDAYAGLTPFTCQRIREFFLS